MQEYTQNEVCELLNITLQTLSHFERTKERAAKKGIILTKTGIGKKARYTITYENKTNIINEGLEINGIKWPEISLGHAKNIKGQKFGKLTPLYRTTDYHLTTKEKGYTQWVCKCDCGNLTVARTQAMQSGNTLSCGCLFKAHDWHTSTFIDLTGKRFGKLTVIEYKGLSSNRKRSLWLCKCDCGNEKIVTTAELVRNDTISCGCLKQSSGELIIENILKQQNINYIKEFSFNDLLSEKKIPLRFDFAILNDNNDLQCLIEYDGEQHYKDIPIWKDKLNQRQQKDNQKNSYCKQHKIPLYRIPYWDKNKITKESLFDNSYLI